MLFQLDVHTSKVWYFTYLILQDLWLWHNNHRIKKRLKNDIPHQLVSKALPDTTELKTCFYGTWKHPSQICYTFLCNGGCNQDSFFSLWFPFFFLYNLLSSAAPKCVFLSPCYLPTCSHAVNGGLSSHSNYSWRKKLSAHLTVCAIQSATFTQQSQAGVVPWSGMFLTAVSGISELSSRCGWYQTVFLKLLLAPPLKPFLCP